MAPPEARGGSRSLVGPLWKAEPLTETPPFPTFLGRLEGEPPHPHPAAIWKRLPPRYPDRVSDAGRSLRDAERRRAARGPHPPRLARAAAEKPRVPRGGRFPGLASHPLIHGINCNNKNLAGKAPLPSKSPQWQNRGRPGGGGGGQTVSSFVTAGGDARRPGTPRRPLRCLRVPSAPFPGGPLPHPSGPAPPPLPVASARAWTLGVTHSPRKALCSFPREEPQTSGS